MKQPAFLFVKTYDPRFYIAKLYSNILSHTWLLVKNINLTTLKWINCLDYKDFKLRYIIHLIYYVIKCNDHQI